MSVLLVIDDDPLVQRVFSRVFENAEGMDVSVFGAETIAAGIDAMAQLRPDVVVLDVKLPDGSGLDGFKQIHDIDPKVPVIFITAGGTSSTAIEAMKLGAYDYLLKPLDFAQVRKLVGRAVETSRAMHVPVDIAGVDPPVEAANDVLVGRCPAIQSVYKEIGRAAPQNVNVLIRGESGTGKELVARAIYHHSLRSSGPFLAINCAAIPEQLLESELFGHEKGAFTGADRQRIGKFEQCTGGTIFMDEIGDMTPQTQSKVLRLLEDQVFERVGGSESIKTDVRIIAATNRNLEEMVADGDFRGDLFFRLNVFSIHLPPLRERGEDVLLLLEHFLARFNKQFTRDIQGFSPDALDLLFAYEWPGNVRELQSALKQAMLRATGPVLVPEFFSDAVRRPSELSAAPATCGEPGDGDWPELIDQRIRDGAEELYAEMQQRMDRILLTRVLQATDGNQLQAAKILGITRGTLRSKIRALGLEISRVVHAKGSESLVDDPAAVSAHSQ
ncbi:MAG: sigma-54-dependent Fis family transcriptional regulator [Planctomycetales bacterium]|nr:sigma-54-dependent Fis family transcriptional regulator [Planctomycetales bacterium]